MKIVKYGEAGELLMRTMETAGVSDAVREIVSNVAKNGDAVSNIGIRMVYSIAEEIQYHNIFGLNVLTIKI